MSLLLLFAGGGEATPPTITGVGSVEGGATTAIIEGPADTATVEGGATTAIIEGPADTATVEGGAETGTVEGTT